MGGEKQELFWALLCASGSPPHGRGKALHRVKNDLRYGITPAQAGKSPTYSGCVLLARDHPRVGGEKPFLFYGGSSDSFLTAPITTILEITQLYILL